MKGPDEHRLKLAKQVLGGVVPKYNERGPQECGQYLEFAETLSEKIPAFGFVEYEEATLCECLERGFSGGARAKVISGLSTTSRRVCDQVKDEEWPGGVGTIPQVPEPPKNAITPQARRRDEVVPAGSPANPWDVAREFSPAIKKCLMDTDVENPYNGVLNTYVQLTALASASGLSQVVPSVKIKSQPKGLRFDGRSGWVTQADMRNTERKVESCIAQAAQSFSPGADSPLRRTSQSKIWLLFGSADIFKAFLLP
jgi:hypothetical protein